MKPITERIRNQEMLPLQKAQEISLPSAAMFAMIMICLLLFGLTMLYSTSFGTAGTGFFYKQIQWAVIGFLGMGGCLWFGYKRISDWSPWFLIAVSLLLIVADLSPAVNGAHRWIKIPGVGNIQPSEYAKVVLALFLAKFLSSRSRFISSNPYTKVLIPGCAVCAVPIVLVLMGKDLGTTVLLSLILLSAMFAAGIKVQWIVIPPVLIGIAGFFYIKYFDAMRWGRMTIFLDPEPYAAGKGYQLYHSLLALGSGNWFGLGFTESRMKMAYLPEAHTDFILSIVGEELGYFFLCLVMIAYLLFLLFAVRIAENARTRQGMILAFTIGLFIGAQALINIGVICGAFPTKGMPAPFISYGGSSLVTCLTASGLVLSVALDSAFPDYPARCRDFLKQHWNLLKEKCKWKN